MSPLVSKLANNHSGVIVGCDDGHSFGGHLDRRSLGMEEQDAVVNCSILGDAGL